ncbi:hypothetical protein MKW94_025704, partial [Papaver nudicaule]|nr:hypothetical protein [Papaver nudicaule]
AIGHTIPQNLLVDIYNVSKQFFDLLVEEKQRYAQSKGDGIFDLDGYGSDSMKAKIDDDRSLDWVEYKNLVTKPVEASVTKIILKATAKSLGFEENDFINQLGDRQYVNTIFNFYPPCPRPYLVYGVRAHTDRGAIIVLLLDPEVGGLQVFKNDQWFSITTIFFHPSLLQFSNIPCVSGSLLINLGDQLQIMRNGILNSPLHKVVTNTERTRILVGMFYAPNIDNEIEPVAALIDESNPRKYISEDERLS